MTNVDTADIRARHQPEHIGDLNICSECSGLDDNDCLYPCDAIRLADALDESQRIDADLSAQVHTNGGFIDRMMDAEDRVTEQAAEIEKLQVLCARLLAGLTP